MAKPIYSPDGIYCSPRSHLPFPSDPDLSLVPFLFCNAAAYPDRLALADADSGQTLTFRQLQSTVSSAAAGLARLGIKKGDVVLICAPNSLLFPVSFLAILSLGAIATTVNPQYTIPELTKQAADSGAKLVITIPNLLDKVSPLRLPVILLSPKNPTFITSTDFPITYFSDLISGPKSDFTPPPIRQSDVAALPYSSGTMGVSKGVELTHRNFISMALMSSADQDLRGEPPNTFLCFLPMFHIVGLSVITYAQLQRGNSVVVMERFEMEMMLRSIERYRVTYLFVVPPVMIALAKKGKVTKYDVSSLRCIGSGAAPLAKNVMEEISKIFPKVEVIQGYGLTESCGLVSLEFSKGEARQFGSVGHLVSGVDSKVSSKDTLTPLPPNQSGELCFRGPNIMQGYLNNPEATRLTLDKQGWLHTGDFGYFDEEGQLYIVGRIKELIKCKGFQVAPAELEGLLISHPEILEAAVIPYPDAEAGEVPVACVVRSPNSSLTGVDVQKFVASQVAPYKRLRKVIFVNDMPKNATGKLLKRLLIEKVGSKL